MNPNTLYIAHRAGPENQLSASLQERGLRYLRSSPCHVDIVVHAQNPSYHYSAYVHNLSAAMLAQTSNVIVSVEPHHFYQCSERDLLPTPHIIDIAFSFNRIDANLEQKLTELGAEQMTYRNKMLYIVRFDELAHLRPILNDDRLNRICAVPDNVMNVNAFLCYCIMSRIANAFFKTHTYPTYASKEQSELSKKRKRDNEIDDNPVTTSSSSSALTISPALLDAKLCPTFKPQNRVGEYYGSGRDDMQGQDGLLCPYEHDLASEDKMTIWKVIEKYFFKSLGESAGACMETFSKIKSALGVISPCRAVKELSHIYKLIDISIMSQTRPYLLVSGSSYLGIILFGAEYKLSNGPFELLEPCPSTQLLGLLQNQSSHQGSLTKLAGVLRKNENDLTSMRVISKFARGCALTEDQKNNVITWCKCLNFNAIPWRLNDSTVLEMFQYMNDPTVPVSEDVYMNPNSVFYFDRYEEVLSAFGYQAPIFDIGGCATISLTNRDPPRKLRYRLVTLQSALGSYRRIKTDRTILNNPSNQLSSIYSERDTDKTKIQEVWTALKSFANAANPTLPSSSSSSSSGQNSLFSF